MTQTALRRGAGNLPRRLAAWVVRLQRLLSDRLFAEGDAVARAHGWEITKITGRFGFGARSYRDPRSASAARPARVGSAPGWRSDARSG